MSTSQHSPLVLASADAVAPAVAAPAQAAAPQTAATVATVGAGQGKGGFSAKPTVGEIAEFQVTGLLVVFVVLGAITAISILMSWLLKVLAPAQYFGTSKPAPAAAPVAKAAPAVAATASGLSHDKLLVLLAAAAQEVLGKSAAVVSYSVADSTWAMQGRAAHHHSHKL